MVSIRISHKNLSAFLAYFYHVEEIAQSTGANTSKKWTDAASSAHEILLKATKEEG